MCTERIFRYYFLGIILSLLARFCLTRTSSVAFSSGMSLMHRLLNLSWLPFFKNSLCRGSCLPTLLSDGWPVILFVICSVNHVLRFNKSSPRSRRWYLTHFKRELVRRWHFPGYIILYLSSIQFCWDKGHSFFFSLTNIEVLQNGVCNHFLPREKKTSNQPAQLETKSNCSQTLKCHLNFRSQWPSDFDVIQQADGYNKIYTFIKKIQFFIYDRISFVLSAIRWYQHPQLEFLKR